MNLLHIRHPGTAWSLCALALGVSPAFYIGPAGAAAPTPAPPSAAMAASPLAGTWALEAADLLHADGSRTRDYGAAPKGRLLVDEQGRYALQIFKSERPRFASDEKPKGSAAEFAAAFLGASTHFGTIAVDAAAQTLVFHIEAASFPNWEGTSQSRRFTLRGDTLSYQVPPRADGTIPVSVWRRIDAPR